MSDAAAVLNANDAFYAAFARRDLAAMDEVWAHGEPICCIHPGWSALYGREEIMASWASIFTADDDPPIRCEDTDVRVNGDAATVICEEHLGEALLVATNTFVRQQGVWRMWHHHAGPVARRVKPAKASPLLN